MTASEKLQKLAKKMENCSAEEAIEMADEIVATMAEVSKEQEGRNREFRAEMHKLAKHLEVPGCYNCGGAGRSEHYSPDYCPECGV